MCVSGGVYVCSCHCGKFAWMSIAHTQADEKKVECNGQKMVGHWVLMLRNIAATFSDGIVGMQS